MTTGPRTGADDRTEDDRGDREEGNDPHIPPIIDAPPDDWPSDVDGQGHSDARPPAQHLMDKRGLNGRREAHGEITDRYARRERAKRQGKRSFSLLGLWVADACRIMRRRHGVVMADIELVRDDLRYLALLMSRLERGKRRFENFAGVNAAWLMDSERDGMWAAAIADPRRPTAIEIARYFELEWIERARFGIRNLPATDVKGPELRKLKAERRRELDRERKRRKRAKRGAVSRAKYLAIAASTTQPWKAEGCSRATWYRRQRRSEPT
jgi:hypothetical protein